MTRLEIDGSGFHGDDVVHACDGDNCRKMALYKLVTEKWADVGGGTFFLCDLCLSPHLLGYVRNGTVLVGKMPK